MVSCYSTIKSNPERLEREKQRVKNFLNNKYLNDEAYREKCKEYSRLYRLKKKLEQEEKENENEKDENKIININFVFHFKRLL